jgi:hypothetical protein
MTAHVRPLADVTHEAIRVLGRELGVVDTIRFINQFSSGYGNYTEERKALFAGMSLDQILDQIRKSKA